MNAAARKYTGAPGFQCKGTDANRRSANQRARNAMAKAARGEMLDASETACVKRYEAQLAAQSAHAAAWKDEQAGKAEAATATLVAKREEEIAAGRRARMLAVPMTDQELAIVAYYGADDMTAPRPEHTDAECFALVKRGLLVQALGSFDATPKGRAVVAARR